MVIDHSDCGPRTSRYLVAASWRTSSALRVVAIAFSGTSAVIVLPAPIMAPAPIVTGATSGVRSNRCAVADQCAEFSNRVITGDCARTYIYILPNGGVTKICQVVGFAANANCGIFVSTKLPFNTVLKDCARPQAREWANCAARPELPRQYA